MQRSTISLPLGQGQVALRVPASTTRLEPPGSAPLPDAEAAVEAALQRPLGCPPLSQLLRQRRPRRVAITLSDITRPVPNRLLLRPLLRLLNQAGVADEAITLIIGTGMHRPSTAEERLILLGRELLQRAVRLEDHRASAPDTLVELSREPPVRVNRSFAAADFRIVTGAVEPHFMAGFSGGRKGVCPALVDLTTIGRFHSYATLSHPRARSGVLAGNPCHEIALQVARQVGVDFLLNVGLNREHELAGVYAGELEQAHQAACREVARWVTVPLQESYDLVLTHGGGYPLDQTFYQSVKGQVEALPALEPGAVLLQVTHCGEGLGSPAYTQLLLRWGRRWRSFLEHLQRHPEHTELDQWELQMQCRVLQRVGCDGLWLVTDGIEPAVQQQLALTPQLGPGSVAERAQQAVDRLLARRPAARVAVIPQGPYTVLK